MTVAPPLPSAPADALARARQVGVILAAVAALIARRFLREPKLLVLIVPLWGWLGRTARRFERAVTQVRPVRTASPRGVRVDVPTSARVPRVRFPGGRGWLVRVLGYEAAGYGSQLQHALDAPEMQALLAAMPHAARVLRPVCRMLGVAMTPAAKAAEAVRAVIVRPERARAPVRPRRPRKEVWDWSPGPIRPPGRKKHRVD